MDTPKESVTSQAVASPQQLFDLSGRLGVVTGGASGLGQAVARGLALAGARIALIDLDVEAADRVAEEIRAAGGVADAFRADVTKSGDLEAVSAEIGTADVLVNSAGMAARFAAEEFPEDVYDRIIALNLKGSFLSCQVFGRPMLAAGRGSIINIASIGASVAYPHATAYLQSKGGVAQLTRSLALEWIGRGVRVNAIAPGLFDTPLVSKSDASTSITSEFIMARTPIGRKGRPEELVGPAVFLASDAASMVTGHILQVDGGYLIA